VARTQSKEVNLTKRVQTPKGMRYCPVVLSPNGRVNPDLVLLPRPRRPGLSLDHWLRPGPAKTDHSFAGVNTG
jgi:hypothetical protein